MTDKEFVNADKELMHHYNYYWEETEPRPKKCDKCGKLYFYADMHYYYDTNGEHCRG
jgi:hypothetical protein